MTFGAPQIILTALILMGAGVNLNRFGKVRSVASDWFDVLWGPGILVGLLWWGGFYG